MSSDPGRQETRPPNPVPDTGKGPTDPPLPPRESRGYVYATTGAAYTTLARRSVRSLRQAMPKAMVDLFTDQDIVDPAFSRIHRLSQTSHRPRTEALIRSRFDRTIYLDADTIPLLPMPEVFALLDLVPLAGTQAVGRPKAMFGAQKHIPRAFPYLNAGMLAIRRTPETMALMRAWERAVLGGGKPKDQPDLRRLMFQMRIPFHVLPLEYNLIHLPALDVWEHYFGAPRMLHVTALHDGPPGDPTEPFDLDVVLGPARAARVRAQLAGTAHLGLAVSSTIAAPLADVTR